MKKLYLLTDPELAPGQAEWSADNWGFITDNRNGTEICQDQSRWASK